MARSSADSIRYGKSIGDQVIRASKRSLSSSILIRSCFIESRSRRVTVSRRAGSKRLNQLNQFKKFTKIVADTGDLESMRAYASITRWRPKKTAECIRKFAADVVKLEQVVAGKLGP
jgi:hypothetical protein